MAAQKGLAVASLFNLTNDTAESKNLIDHHPQIVQKFQSELKLWNADMEKTKTPQPK
jgi:hypothetical protein